MKSFEYTIKEPVGLHARPAGMLNKEARKYKFRNWCTVFTQIIHLIQIKVNKIIDGNIETLF